VSGPVEGRDGQMERQREDAAVKRGKARKVLRYWLAGVLLGVVLIAGVVMSLIFVERWVRAHGAEPRLEGTTLTQPERSKHLPEVTIEPSETEATGKRGGRGKRGDSE
jgi:hypothetical protein